MQSGGGKGYSSRDYDDDDRPRKRGVDWGRLFSDPQMVKIALGVIGFLIVLTLILIAAAVIWYQVEAETDFGRAISSVGKPMKCPPSHPNSTGLLCNEACPKNMTWDGAQLCLGSVPPYWTGKDGNKQTPTDLLRDYKYDPIGANGINDLACQPGEEKYAGLCYKVNSGEAVTTPGFVGQKCESNVTDSGTSCYYALPVGTIPSLKTDDNGYYSYSPGCGWWPFPCHDGKNNCRDDCYKNWNPRLNTYQVCPSGQENVNGLCFPKCRPGYNHVLGHCTKSKNIRSVIGTVPNTCTPDKQYIDGLCYPKCSRFGQVTNWDGTKQDKYVRTRDLITGCLEKCPPGYTTTGALTCMKPSKMLPVAKGLADIGVCDSNQDKIGLLCYPKKVEKK